MALNLGKQYGPLPLGGWAVVIIGGLGVGYFINRSQGESSSSGEEESETPVGEESGAGGGQFIYDPPTGVETPSTAITTNMQWGQKAKDWLAGKGFDAYLSTNAVEKYLSGQSLTVQERAWISLVIAQFGSPPEGVTPVDTPSTPKPPTTPPKPIPRPVPQPKKVYAISIKQKPATVRRGQAAAFAGDLSYNTGGKAHPASGMILVERRKPNSSTWSPHTVDGSNSKGKWGLNIVFGSPGTWGVRVRHSSSGATASTTIRVT